MRRRIRSDTPTKPPAGFFGTFTSELDRVALADPQEARLHARVIGAIDLAGGIAWRWRSIWDLWTAVTAAVCQALRTVAVGTSGTAG